MISFERDCFEGRRILIAGASSGIGKNTAIFLSKAGAGLVLVARREERLKEVVSELEGTGHKYYIADLSDTDNIGTLMKEIVNDNGPLDGMVFSAGTASTVPLKMFDPKRVEEVMRINFFAYYELVRQFSKKGRYNPDAKIVGVSSMASIGAAKGQSVYSASKAAMDAVTRVLSQELMDKGININTVRPVFVRTEMYEEYIKQADMVSEVGGMNRINHSQPLGVIEMDDVSYMISYLLSSAARYITGQQFDIRGGRV